MTIDEKNKLIADFVGIRAENGRCVIDGALFWHLTKVLGIGNTVYNSRPMLFDKSWDWLIVAIKMYLDVDYTKLKDSDSINLVMMHKNILKNISVADEIIDIFEKLVEAVKDYNIVKKD